MSQRGLRAIRKQLSKPDPRPWVGRLGNAAGTVEVPGRTGLWYVRPKGSDLPVVVQAGSAPRVANTEVLVRADPYRPGRVRVLGLHATDGGTGSEQQAVEAHADSHLAGGSDPVYLSTTQVINGLVYASTGMTIKVNPGWAIINGLPVKFATTTIDLDGAQPVSGAYWMMMLVTVDGLVDFEAGAVVDSLADLTPAAVPIVTYSCAPLALVRLYAGQTALSRQTAAPDVIDLRFAPGQGAISLASLADVDIPSPVDGEVLTYDGGTDAWVAAASGGTDGAAIHDNVSGEIAAVTEKTTPAAADLTLIEDSAASNAKKRLQLGNLFAALGREKLTAARTYYVRTDGNDANTGLANNAGGAFLTIQKAVDTVAQLDINAQTVTIQVGDGTYTGAVELKNVPGFAAPGNLVIQGNNGTPANVVVSVTDNNCFQGNALSSVWDIKDLKVTTATSGHGLVASNGAFVRFSNISFGACVGSHLQCTAGGEMQATGGYAISGSAQYHIYCATAIVRTQVRTIAVAAGIGFTRFVNALIMASVYINGNTYNLAGAVTGVRYYSDTNSVIYVNGAGATYLPGGTSGGTNNGGLYV